MSTLALPVCSCCHRHIMPNDRCVKFNCPECGAILIWRCESCRESARTYTCGSCGFQGP
ncbi:MAG: RNA-binding protein [Thaumarchaeota archaeon]|nr:RNA-binding protein [Nitrososphaerota archaeon]